MPKLFPISIEVEEVAVGRVLRVLNSTAGIVKLHLSLTQEKEVKPENQEYIATDLAVQTAPALMDGRSKKRGGPISQNKMYRAVMEVLVKAPAHYRLLSAAVERAGFKGSGIHGLIFRLGKMKFVIRTSPGSYRITEKGQKVFFGSKFIPYREPKKSLPASLYKVTNNYSGCRLLILTALNDGVSISSNNMKSVVVRGGFSAKNLSTTGMKMRREGLITFVDGQYQLTERGKSVLDRRPPIQEQGDLDFQTDNTEGVEANG
jgi:predicted transcriptional regulator